MQRPRKTKNIEKKIHARARKATLSEPVAMDEKMFVEATRNSVEKKREQKEE